MQISLKQLVYFIAVAESGSISRALTSLNVTQSVVTEAIKKLEVSLGTDLFTRHARGMILTHAGHQFLRHAHEVLAALRNAEQAIRERPITNVVAVFVMLITFLPIVLAQWLTRDTDDLHGGGKTA